jgi:DNA (cytosine-5)-methyltransferase 1
VVTPFLVEMRGTKESNLNTSGKDIAKPIGTITAGGIHHSIVQPYLVPTNHGGGLNRAGSIEEPLPTVCGNRGEQAVIEPHLLPQHSCGALRPVSQPAPTIATAGAIAIVEPFLTKFYGTGQAASLENPLDTVTTKDRFALVCPEVVIDGQRYRVRLRWRMLQPHELAQGQSFPKGYQFTGTKTDAVKQIGNAVPPAIANALMKAHFNES